MPFLSSTDKVDQLLRQCTGQRVKIPFLYSLFPAWQAHFNPVDDLSTEDELRAFQKRYVTRTFGTLHLLHASLYFLAGGLRTQLL